MPLNLPKGVKQKVRHSN